MTRMTYLVIPDTLSAPQIGAPVEAAHRRRTEPLQPHRRNRRPWPGLLKFWDEVRAEIEAWVGKS